MTESDRHIVICALAADLYNEHGCMENIVMSIDDFNQQVEYYQERHALMGIRMPTRNEVYVALTQVMGVRTFGAVITS